EAIRLSTRYKRHRAGRAGVLILWQKIACILNDLTVRQLERVVFADEIRAGAGWLSDKDRPCVALNKGGHVLRRRESPPPDYDKELSALVDLIAADKAPDERQGYSRIAAGIPAHIYD